MREAQKYLEGYFEAVEIFSKGMPVMHIFSRTKEEKAKMDTEKYDKFFDKKFGNINGLAVENYFKND